MFKKLSIGIAAIVAFSFFAQPAQAQLGKKLGKSLEKTAKAAASAVGDVAGEMATDMAANKVSEKIANFMDNNNSVAEADNEYFQRLQSILTSGYTSVDGMELNYKVYLNDEANILSLPDGNIRIYSGMMDILEDDELLGVISNQIGHIANKDTRNALLNVATEDNANKAAGNQLEKMLSFSGDKLGSIINELIQVPYTDEQNKAADQYACELMKKNGTSVSALKSALNKFAELESADASAEEEGTELSTATKFIGVNSNNYSRAYLIQ